MKILAIESSCDETAAAVIEKNGNDVRILSNIVASQIPIHKKYGGVFPEMASRAHTEKIIEVAEEAIDNNKIDIVAVTTGPGLIGSLLIGVNFAKTFAFVNNLPIIGINHLLGHIYSNFSQVDVIHGDSIVINSDSSSINKSQSITNNHATLVANHNLPQFPALILIVSGGHTGLYLMKSHTDIMTLGETLDDAAGEAFDKVSKLLGLGYPGGPAISKAAKKLSLRGACDEAIYHVKLPRPMLLSGDYNFSFSGLKTAVLHEVNKIQKNVIYGDSGVICSDSLYNDKSLNHDRPGRSNHYQSQIASEFQQAVIDVLIGKTLRAAAEFKPKSICLCGGVSANKELRSQFQQQITQSLNHATQSQITFHCPPIELTTDNAAMIGLAAAYHIDQKTTFDKINADANLKLS